MLTKKRTEFRTTQCSNFPLQILAINLPVGHEDLDITLQKIEGGLVRAVVVGFQPGAGAANPRFVDKVDGRESHVADVVIVKPGDAGGDVVAGGRVIRVKLVAYVVQAAVVGEEVKQNLRSKVRYKG